MESLYAIFLTNHESRGGGLLFDVKEMVFEALEERFGFAEKSLKQQITKMGDRKLLKKLFHLIFIVNSNEEILQR